jgi:hypothetical protein
MVIVRSKACRILDRSNTGIVGSNPARGTVMCPRLCFAVLCRKRPYDGLIPRLEISTEISELVHSFGR